MQFFYIIEGNEKLDGALKHWVGGAPAKISAQVEQFLAVFVLGEL